MGRGTRESNQATTINLRPAAPAGQVPAWARNAGVEAAPAAEPVAAVSAPSSNDDIRSLLAGANARRMQDLMEQGPDRSGKRADRKEARKQHTRAIMDAATAASMDLAASDDGMRALLRAYAQAPDYSISNLLSARGQIERRNESLPADEQIDPAGLKFSRTAWKALGCEIKPGFEEPRGEDRGSDWDSRYAVTMFSPTKGWWKKTDELDENGEPKKIFVPSGEYATFTAYHEDAVQAIGGGPRPELPEVPWSQSTGSDDDARQLLADVKRVCEWEKLELDTDAALSGGRVDHQGMRRSVPESARYDAAGKKLLVSKDVTPAEQATAAVRALAEHFARPVDEQRAEKAGYDPAELNKAAAEATKFVIASLYGLESDEQTFPHLRGFADDKRRMGALNGEIHYRVGKILDYLDPRREAKAKAAAEIVKERAGKRREKQATQRKTTRRRAAAA